VLMAAGRAVNTENIRPQGMRHSADRTAASSRWTRSADDSGGILRDRRRGGPADAGAQRISRRRRGRRDHRGAGKAQEPHPIKYDNVPSVTLLHPEVASIGLTEEQCKEKKLDYVAGKFPFSANGRARGTGETEGFVKILRDKKYGEILGAHHRRRARLRDDPRAGGGARERIHRRRNRSRDSRASNDVGSDRRGGARFAGTGPAHLSDEPVKDPLALGLGSLACGGWLRPRRA